MEKQHWLSYVNLSDHYERKARFLPALLSYVFLLPATAALDLPFTDWYKMIAAGVGIGCAMAVGLSHIASAAGNRFQEKLWPKWPFDSPTNQWLLPEDSTRSQQQKEIWYAAINRLTGLNIPSAKNSGKQEVEKVINDAVSTIRYMTRNSEHGDRLRVHNADYGFARNFAGLYPLWVSFSLVDFIVCWIGYLLGNVSLLWGIISTSLLMGAFLLAFKVLPKYVRLKAKQYAESFFGALIELDRANQLSNKYTC